MAQRAERHQIAQRVRSAFPPCHDVVNVQAVAGGVGGSAALAPVSVAVEHNLPYAPPRAPSRGRGAAGLVSEGSGVESAGSGPAAVAQAEGQLCASGGSVTFWSQWEPHAPRGRRGP